MGTNYYCELKDTVKVICNYGCEHEIHPKLHIGKDSIGWAFTLQGIDDGTYHLTNADEWEKALQNADHIYDEYGEEVSIEVMMRHIRKASPTLTRQEFEGLQAYVKEQNSMFTSNPKVAIVNGLLYNEDDRLGEDGNYVVVMGNFE